MIPVVVDKPDAFTWQGFTNRSVVLNWKVTVKETKESFSHFTGWSRRWLRQTAVMAVFVHMNECTVFTASIKY